ncbi:MAG: class I SAM-dependent methyltransferase, partial [Methanocellales archaeon]|nr:class I SAM-dependent methyltransferase [Methanocellales archaeon]
MTSTRTIYERLAFLYDLDDVMCLGAKQHWRKKIVKELDVEGKLALDIATGTGRTAKILSKKNGRVIGVDFSWNMLKIARIRNRGRDNLALIQCNAEHLPFRDETFDVVTCTCGMDTVDAPEAVFSEAVRVLKLGGKIGMMYFTEPEGWLRYLDPIIKKF